MARIASFSVIICALSQGVAVHASGAIPMMEQKREFKSASECRTFLKNELVADRSQTTKGRIGFRDGMVKEVSLITDGLVRQPRGVTVYKSEVWRSFGVPADLPRLPDKDGGSTLDITVPMMTFSHSFVKRMRVCADKFVTVTGSDGHTLQTFE